jgi:TolA-binding protein
MLAALAWPAAGENRVDPAQGPQRGRAAYDQGCKAFGAGDYATAVRSLSELAPFEQAGEMGLHAQYLLARVHHLSGERPEAAAGYAAMVAGWENTRKDAKVAPDFVARGLFYWGVALSEFGRADEALGKFATAVAVAPADCAIVPEARLFGARTAVQVKKYSQAMSLLTPIREDAKFGSEALRWVAKAQYGIGLTPVARGNGPAAQMNAAPDPTAVAAGIKQAIETLTKASGSATGADRGTVLLELGDYLQLDRRYAEAAKAYGSAASLGAADVIEQALARQGIALQLAGDFAGSDRLFESFLKRFEKSELRAEVGERYAENALLAAYKSGAAYDEAVARFERVIAQHPETVQANLAGVGMANVHYLKGEYDRAAALNSKIPEGDRVDDLIWANFLLADCRLRGLPEKAEDALTGARVAQTLEEVMTQLEAFVASRPAGAPESAEALVRIGYASGRLASMLVDPVEKRRTLARGRRAYLAILQQYSDSPLYPVAMLENSHLMAQVSGGAKTASVMELGKFAVEPLNHSPLAPPALIHLGDAQRLRRQPLEAIRVLEDVRGRYGAELAKDPKRAGWAVALRSALALSYKEAGKYDLAREAFAALAKDFPDRPEGAEAGWRIAQCESDPALARVESDRRALMAVSGKAAALPQQLLAALMESTAALRHAAQAMGDGAAALAAKGDDSPAADVAVKMNYDAAWCWNSVGQVEVEAARRAGQADPISLQPGERMAREKFKAVIDAGAESPLADDARLELAEIYGQRGEADAAIALLLDAANKAVNPDAALRLKLRVASLYLTKNDSKSAGELALQLINLDREGPTHLYARAVAAEAAYRQRDWASVIEHGKVFMETTKGVGKLSGVADHAMLRMAAAQAELKQWTEAKGTLDTWFGRFRNGPLTAEATLLLGRVNEGLKNVDGAIAAYREVAARYGGEIGAKAKEALERLEHKPAANEAGTAAAAALTPAQAKALDRAKVAKRGRPLIVVEPASAPRIPNLLPFNPRRSVSPTLNPIFAPAGPVASPAVNNAAGGSELSVLGPVARGIAVEVAPMVAPLAFDREPYVRSASAGDEGVLVGR